MLVLAIDTSTKVGSVALYSQEKGIIGELIINNGSNHSETIMSCIDTLFKITKIEVKEIDKIAVSTGPGSFTGIRIGVGIAKGLAYSLKKPIVGVNELDAIGNLAGFTDRKIISMIDARKGRVYYSVYSYNENKKLCRETEYLDGEVLEIAEKYKNEKTVFLGDGAINYNKEIVSVMGDNAIFYSRALSIPKAGILAELGLEKEEDNLVMLEPYYHSKTQAEREKQK